MKKNVYGLIGFPLGHSFSKRYFTEKFKKENINAVYQNFELDTINQLPQIITKNPDLYGLNVTIPYKEQVLEFLDEIDDTASEIKAVNTIKIIRQKNKIILKGFNTDVFGFEISLKPILRSHHNKALILGTGGASKAIKYVLEKNGIEFKVVSRTKKNPDILTYNELNKTVIEDYKIIINCTPLGTYPKIEARPDIPYEFLTKNHLLYDLVYNPEFTLFMKSGKEQQAVVKNGYDMLVGQAEKAWQIWNT